MTPAINPITVFTGTTPEKPFVLIAFFGNSTVTLNAQGEGMTITGLSADLPDGVVGISGNSITFHSNYYDVIPLTVHYTSNGTPGIGYVLIKRVGIDIQEYSKHGQDTCQTNHGSQPGIVFEWGNDDCAIYATYYYPSVSTGKVDLYCTYTWADGSVTGALLTERVSTGDPYGLFTDTDDFCVYKGLSGNKPVSVSIIAVQKGAFGAVTFDQLTLSAGSSYLIKVADFAGSDWAAKSFTVSTGHTHVYSGTWSKDAVQHWHECTCGEKADAAAHSFGEWMQIKAATATATGSKERVCSVCGNKETAVIAATGTSGTPSEDSGKTIAKAPKTGDTADIGMWIVLLLGAGGALTILSAAKKRKKHDAG